MADPRLGLRMCTWSLARKGNDALTFLRAGDDVLQEVDRHGLVRREVRGHVDREEVVALPLRLVLGPERLHVHRRLLLDLVHVLLSARLVLGNRKRVLINK